MSSNEGGGELSGSPSGLASATMITLGGVWLDALRAPTNRCDPQMARATRCWSSAPTSRDNRRTVCLASGGRITPAGGVTYPAFRGRTGPNEGAPGHPELPWSCPDGPFSSLSSAGPNSLRFTASAVIVPRMSWMIVRWQVGRLVHPKPVDGGATVDTGARTADQDARRVVCRHGDRCAAAAADGRRRAADRGVHQGRVVLKRVEHGARIGAARPCYRHFGRDGIRNADGPQKRSVSGRRWFRISPVRSSATQRPSLENSATNLSGSGASGWRVRRAGARPPSRWFVGGAAPPGAPSNAARPSPTASPIRPTGSAAGRPGSRGAGQTDAADSARAADRTCWTARDGPGLERCPRGSAVPATPRDRSTRRGRRGSA